MKLKKFKKDYFKNYFGKKKKWYIHDLERKPAALTLKHKSKRQPSIINVKGKGITNPKNIANDLNIFCYKYRP